MHTPTPPTPPTPYFFYDKRLTIVKQEEEGDKE
jgi:hypothetical protein